MKAKHNLPPWLKPNAKPARFIVGVGWYTEENWKVVKASAVDPDRFENTFQDWIEMAEDSLQKLQAAGISAEKSYIEANALLTWCLAHNKANSAASRAEYVSQAGVQNHTGAA